jgi:hypothetical protein
MTMTKRLASPQGKWLICRRETAESANYNCGALENKTGTATHKNEMNKMHLNPLNTLVLALVVSATVALCAETTPGAANGEPDKSMTAAHESFVKKDMNKAAEQIHMAAAAVKKQSAKVAQGSKEEMKKAGDEMDKLGDGVKKGTMTSEAELKKTFGKVDHQIAGCWHKTAIEAKKSGKDASEDLKKAGASLSGAAKWSGAKLNDGASSSVEAIKKAGQGVGKGAKASADEVDKWFKNLGEGIDDLGRKL